MKLKAGVVLTDLIHNRAIAVAYIKLLSGNRRPIHVFHDGHRQASRVCHVINLYS